MSEKPKPRKSYLPLESNPEVFTGLIRKLGVHTLEFVDVFSIEDFDLLAMIPRPALALVLVFPTSDAYEQHRTREDADKEVYSGKGDGEDVIWYKQTIHNACGLYAILHAVSNGSARDFISPDSILSSLLTKITPLSPDERAAALEDSQELEVAHTHAAKQGDTAAPASAEDEVDFHYVCFAPSHKHPHKVYELDGGRQGPIDKGITLHDGDVLSERGLPPIREFIEREAGENTNFCLLALVPSAF